MQDGVYVGRLLSGNYVGLAIARLPPASPWGTQFPKINPPKTKIFATLFLYDSAPTALPYALQGRQGAWRFDESKGLHVQISHHRSGSGKDRRTWASHPGRTLVASRPWSVLRNGHARADALSRYSTYYLTMSCRRVHGFI
jgi:hypothetical protein